MPAYSTKIPGLSPEIQLRNCHENISIRAIMKSLERCLLKFMSTRQQSQSTKSRLKLLKCNLSVVVYIFYFMNLFKLNLRDAGSENYPQ